MPTKEPWREQDNDDFELEAEFLESITGELTDAHDRLRAQLESLGLDPDDLPGLNPALQADSYESYHSALQLSQMTRKIAERFMATRPASAIVLNRAGLRVVVKIARGACARFDGSCVFAKNRARALGAARAVRKILKSFQGDDPADAQVSAALEVVERVMELIRNDVMVRAARGRYQR